jgi:hypothetical protein
VLASTESISVSFVLFSVLYFVKNLVHVVTVELEEFKDIHTVRSDGVTIKSWPLKTHCYMLKCFLLWFKQHNGAFYCTTSEDVVLLLKKNVFDEYVLLRSMLKIMQQPIFLPGLA